MKAWPGYTVVAADPATIMKAVATTGPVVVLSDASDSFYAYAGGELLPLLWSTELRSWLPTVHRWYRPPRS